MTYQKQKIAVIGLGYIGLPTCAVLARSGYSVMGVDTNKAVVETINAGKIHIVEPHLGKLVEDMVSEGRLKAFNSVQEADIYIICVPTPFDTSSTPPCPDVSYVMEAISSIAKFLKNEDLVIIESTSPVGTTELVINNLDKKGVDVGKIHVAYCPERVLPGNIIDELIQNDRIIGGANPNASRQVAKFYQTFVVGDILETDARTAEMCKLTENSFRDVNIAFANELSMYCDKNGVDVWRLIKLANRHPRVNILQPGTGVGGHCIAVDPWFIISSDQKNTKLMKTARDVNNSKPKWVIEKIIKRCAELGVRKIFCLGLAFKPDVDDLRESPAIQVVEYLNNQNFEVKVVEPNITQHDKYRLVGMDEVLFSFDSLIVILVRHKDFGTQLIAEKLKDRHVLDFCGLIKAVD